MLRIEWNGAFFIRFSAYCQRYAISEGPGNSGGFPALLINLPAVFFRRDSFPVYVPPVSVGISSGGLHHNDSSLNPDGDG